MNQPPQRNIAMFLTMLMIVIGSVTLPFTSRRALDVMRQRRPHAHH